MFSSCSSFYGNLVDNQVKKLQDLTNELAQVNDKASADAMVPKVSEYGAAFGEVFKGVSTNGNPSWLELYRMKSQLESDSTKGTTVSFLTQIARLNINNFYGSQELKDSIWNQYVAARQAAGY